MWKWSALLKHASVNVSTASFVSSADVILEIIDTYHIHLKLSVFDKDILKIKKIRKLILEFLKRHTVFIMRLKLSLAV